MGAKISLVRDRYHNAEYFVFERKIKQGTKTKADKFKIRIQVETDHQNSAQLLLKLSGMKQKIRNRWVKIDKSLDFLNFLIDNSQEYDQNLNFLDDTTRRRLQNILVPFNAMNPDTNDTIGQR